MKYPPRIPRTVTGSKREPREGDCPQHRAWIRQQPCIAEGMCGGQMHAHHVRNAANSGTGTKPEDRFCVPVCAYHHDRIHNWGAETFEGAYKVNLMAEAEKLAARSPALRRSKA